MKVTITIDCTNAAFSENPGQDVHNILQKASEKFLNYDYSLKELDQTKLKDYNGNSCGLIKVEE